MNHNINELRNTIRRGDQTTDLLVWITETQLDALLDVAEAANNYANCSVSDMESTHADLHDALTRFDFEQELFKPEAAA